MTSFKVTRKAFDDLINIGKYTQDKWGVLQRNTYLKQLDDCFVRLSENPDIGIPSVTISKKDISSFLKAAT